MVEAAYRHHGLDARYLNCEVAPEALGDAVAGARAMGWAGFNCSLPHKVAVIEHLDRLAASAEVIGAVNTVVATDGELVGPQHRRPGLRRVAAHRRRPRRAPRRGARRRRCRAGGGGRDRPRGRGLRHRRQPRTRAAARSSPASSPRAPACPRPTCPGTGRTGAGRRRRARPRDVGRLRGRRRPGRPRARHACGRAWSSPTSSSRRRAPRCCGPRRSGAPRPSTASGMLVGQGALAVRHWTGVEPDRDVMRAAARRRWD